MGRSFIDLATFFTRTNFLGYPFSLVICFFSERLFVFPFVAFAYSWPGLVFSLCLHLWEVCMSGILRRIQPRGYVAGTLGLFCLMSYWTAGISSLSMACHS